MTKPFFSGAIRSFSKMKCLVWLIGFACLASCAIKPAEKPQEPQKKEDPAVAAERRLQEDLAARAHLAGFRRVQRVAYPILKVAAPNCLDARRLSIGISPVNGSIFPKNLQEAAMRIGPFGKIRPLVFLNVLPGTPAYAAGVREGDTLVSIGEQKLEPTSFPEEAERIVHEQALKSQTVTLGVQRKGEALRFDVRPEWVCRQRYVFDGTDIVNAINLFDTTIVFGGALRLFPRDEELAPIIAHELAHGLLRHGEENVWNAMWHKTRTPEMSQQREKDADALGLRLAAAAGYDVSQAEGIFRRFAQAAPSAISTATTHPTTPERMVAMNRLIADIGKARGAGDSVFIEQARYTTYFAESVPIDENSVKELVKRLPWMESPVRKTLGGKPASLPRADDPALNDWAGIPALDGQGRVAYQQWLQDERRPRVFVLSASGAWGRGFGPQAEGDALEACRASAAESSCYIYARNASRVLAASDERSIRESVMTNAAKSKQGSKLSNGHTRVPPAESDFAAATDIDAVPASASCRKMYEEYRAKRGPKAFAVKSSGGCRYTNGSADVMERLIAECERAGDLCWLYAVDNSVVWHREVDARISRVSQLQRVDEQP